MSGLLRLPLEEHGRFLGCRGWPEGWTDPAPPAAVLFGAPLDATVSYRPGARFAPARIRDVSGALEEYSPVLDADLFEARVADAGDLAFPPGNVTAALDAVEACSGAIADGGAVPVMLGGEHLVTLPAVKAAAARFRGLRVVHLDAHADMRDDYLGERLSHATVMRRVSEVVGERAIYHLGVRSGTRDELRAIRGRNVPAGGLEESLGRLVDMIGSDPAYVTLDIDVLDPAFAPGTGTPEPGGVTARELLGAISRLGHLDVVGFDLVEVSPPYDCSDITSIVAARIIREVLLALHLRRSDRLSSGWRRGGE